LLRRPDPFAVQRAGIDALQAVTSHDLAAAQLINSRNGQQVLLFNAFRDVLASPIAALRTTLSGGRLEAIQKVTALSNGSL
jgi:hypothetical protein